MYTENNVSNIVESMVRWQLGVYRYLLKSLVFSTDRTDHGLLILMCIAQR